MSDFQNVGIIHHGAVDGVTGSCHQLNINSNSALLVDCGLFQGAETAGKANATTLEINFDITNLIALLVTHCHIDHVGRIPYLLAAGFNQPIYATTATAALLPIVIADALKVGVTKNKRLIDLYLNKLQQLIIPIEYNSWFPLPVKPEALASLEHTHSSFNTAKAKFKPAGHILGSAYVEIELSNLNINPLSDKDKTNKLASIPINTEVNCRTYSHSSDQARRMDKHKIVFSGDLGATYTPLLASPKSPYRADTLIIESTYGDKNHESRQKRTHCLRKVIEKAVSNNGVVLIPAFSIGRTQELLYELEQIIHQKSKHPIWSQIEIIVDSPLAAKFTEQYIQFKRLWDNEAKKKLNLNRHPLDFEQLYTVDTHEEHLSTINYLANRNKPAIVIAASGMCSGGRIMNYLEKFLPKSTADVIFVGYQAKGTPGREIQTYGPQGGYVYINSDKIDINAGIHTISGYSAHADQHNLINFVKRMHHKPRHIRIVHGDEDAKHALAAKYRKLLPEAEVVIGRAEMMAAPRGSKTG
ncbi:putative exonuclease of the beta-lactamase fold involved in RNA processing [Shewanella psychrophila]|uniref:Putative exonuclease of the beta-lactamase fold involved in RNA processing n=1 Tax=Shewanella psychrophila TaxID=225848 RepID=A0A1S6HTI4_9GAMM|nr:MBL fold metallo-hydrolase [Shewanella psychrophila]AQS38867.1 putative exonuclease of the beta-lactamase fold involved in RNA processing [Shewanella psychrophila]